MSIREQNKITVLKEIMAHDGVSRAELARKCELTRPTLSSIAAEFIEMGFIKESGKGESLGGKRPILLKLDCDTNFIIGIDLADGDYIRGVLCDFSGEIKIQEKIKHTGDFEHIIESIKQLIHTLQTSPICKTLKGI